MKIAGIDPGFSGSLVIIETTNTGVDIIRFYDKYIYKISGKSEYDIPLMCKILTEEKPDNLFIEKAQAMPGQGVTSMFKIGYGFGIWKGIVTAKGIPMEIITPQAWQKEMFAGVRKSENTKETAYHVISSLRPDITPQLKGPRGGLIDGRGDAFLIAEYGKRKLHI